MPGFFTNSDLLSSRPKPTLVPRCDLCRLCLRCESPKMPVYGKGERKVLVCGEAPGCVSGETLIDTAFRDKSIYPDGIPIKDLVGKKDFFVYSFDVKKRRLALGKVKRVWKTGRKEVYRVTFEWFAPPHRMVRSSILVTSNHRFLLRLPKSKNPFKGNGDEKVYVSIDSGLEFGHSLQPFLRGNHKVISVDFVGVKDVYDMEVEDYHNFVANGIFIHNSTEDSQGRPFVGDSGQELRSSLAKIGVDLDRDCWTTNSLICHPWEEGEKGKRNRTPTDKEIDWCRPNVIRAIEELKPETILLLGMSAVKSVIGWAWQESVGEMGRWIGWRIPSVKLNSWLCPVWHPSFVMRVDYGNSAAIADWKGERENPTRKVIWERHLKRAFKLQGRPWKEAPVWSDPQSVKVELDVGLAAKWIRRMIGWNKPVAFDYETNMLKPDSAKAEIVCCSVSDGEVSVAFPWHGEAKRAMRELLKSNVPKIASNLKFEDRWTRKEFGFSPRNWLHDTMIAAHVLDNRGSISSIKFQAFVLLGVDSWDEKIKGQFKDGGDLVKAVGLERLLRYCALDSLYEWHVCMKQRRKLT